MVRNLLALLVLSCMLLLVGCDEVKYADRTLKSAEAIYTTVHAASNQVWLDTSIPQEDRIEFKEVMLPLLASTEATITAGNVSLQAYISAKSPEAKSALLSAVSSLVGNVMTLAKTYNRTAANLGKKEVVVPDNLASAFGLLE